MPVCGRERNVPTMRRASSITRVTTWIATVIALVVSVVAPLSYFVVSYNYAQGTLDTQAEMNSHTISGVISASPELWRYQQVRLEELLSRRQRAGYRETLRIVDLHNTVIAEMATDLGAPVMTRSHVLYDAGKAVASIEISVSLRPLLARTGLVALFGMAVGLLVFVTLRVLPLRAVDRAEEEVQRHLAQLEQANEDLRNYTFLFFHDLRTPMVSIAGFSGELRAVLHELGALVQDKLHAFNDRDRERLRAALLSEIPQALTFIDSSVKRMETLMNSVQAISRLGNRGLKPAPIDMNEAVRNVLRSFADRIEQQGVTVRTGKLLPVTADRSAMELILYSLIDNALKYREPGRTSEIGITAEENDDEVMCHIQDNGRGIAREDMHKVFELFRRAGKQDVPGEGMGLAHVNTLVRRQGGRIWCESKLGVGTTFSFTMPRNPVLKEEK